ncbi:alpha-hydroxy-acid oxidizing protein [Patescibacteria group bacterium]|nr:alpha-hydroxy-acid oxidizing protein [Patescibacteria group bacterium]
MTSPDLPSKFYLKLWMLLEVEVSKKQRFLNSYICSGFEKKIEVWIDGGIRRGTDILKALALGATGKPFSSSLLTFTLAVGIGRPALYGLAAYGQEGVEQVLRILKAELDMSMRLIGAPTISDIKPNMVITRNLDNHVSVIKDHLSTGKNFLKAVFLCKRQSAYFVF